MLNVTEACNSRCVMCGIWRKKSPLSLDIDSFRAFLKNNREYLDQVKTVGLVGGEPFLTRDYLEYFRLLKQLPNLKSVGQPTNALVPGFYLKKVSEALAILPKNVFFGISVSLDGIGKKQEQIRGVKDAFERSREFIEQAIQLFDKYDNFYLTLTATISKYNIHQIRKIEDFARQMRLRCTFRPAIEVDAVYINNREIRGWQLEHEDPQLLKKEFARLYAETGNEYYHSVNKVLNGKKREFSCPFQNEGFVINPDGQIFTCLFSAQGRLGVINEELPVFFGSSKYERIKNKMARDVCSSCLAECFTSKSSFFKPMDYLELQLGLLLSGKISKFKNNLMKNKLYIHNRLIKMILKFRPGRVLSSLRNLTDEEKIVLNVGCQKEKYKINKKNRNGIHLDFRGGDLLSILINLARYYYIIKIYSKTDVFLRLIKRYFQPQIKKSNLKKDIDNLEKIINL